MLIALVLLAALAGAWLTYRHLEPRARGAWLPLACRAVAWAAVGLLLLDPAVASGPPAGRPLVLLDASLSLRADSARWRRAQDTARALGGVRWFGDGRPWTDSTAERGRSDLTEALTAAAATGRRVVVVTDGELDGFDAVPADLRAGTAFVVLPRGARRDFSVEGVRAPGRLTVGDSLHVMAEVRAAAITAPESVVVTLRLGARILARRRLVLAADLPQSVTLDATTRGLPAGTDLLSVRIDGPGDEEPRNDARLLAVDLSATPGIVVLVRPGDWDGRFLYRTLRSVTDLAVRGFVSVEPGAWRDMERLHPVSAGEVRSAARGANLLVIRGDVGDALGGQVVGRVWRWPEARAVQGEWYVAPAGASPVAMAFSGVPPESLPPVAGVGAIPERPGDWVGATAQLGRRGAPRPVWVGRQSGPQREVLVAADGFWRWGFRGGLAGDAYRVLVASTVSWLLAAPDAVAGLARPLRPVVEQGMPLVFSRGADSVSRLPITLSGPVGDRTDTLRFGGDGTAEVYLPPGRYRYRVGGGRAGTGIVAVDTWSAEWAHRAPVVESRRGSAAGAGGRRTARDLTWLYLLALAGLAGEWVARRRLGLR